ncbi:MAG: MMPL family transporter, partial [Deltaproteobacteria bacterium]|nr:MMPL family transporter [Nannocystaceae bacterium]
MAEPASDRLFRGIADLGVRRPWWVGTILVLVLLGAAALSSQMTVSTSRTGLISDDNPDQARLLRFFERFGRPDAPLVLVSGGTPEQQRALVDRLQAAYESETNLAGRVLARLRPRDVAEVALLQQPGALAQARAQLPAGTDLATLVESGVEGWLGMLADSLERSLDASAGDDEAAPSPTAEQLVRGLEQLELLGGAASGLGQYLGGASIEDRFADAMGAMSKGGIDERGYLVTGDGAHHLVALYPAFESDEGAELKPMVERLRAIRDEVMVDAPAGLTAEVTGLPAIIVDELAFVQSGLQSSTIWATLGILLLCWLLFRSVFQTIAANLPLLPGVVITLGAVQLLYGHLNLITSSFVAVLLGLGIDFSVHVVSRFNEAVRAGAVRAEAVRQALVRTGPGIMSGAIITAAGFLAGVTTEFTAYGELGVITAVGLLVMVLCTFALLPVLLGRGRGDAPPKVSDEPPGLAALPGLVRRRRHVLAVVGIVAGVLGILGISRIDFDPRYFGFLPEKAESGHALIALEYDPIASPVFANLSADSMERAREMTAKLRALDTVAGVQSPTDLVPPIGPTEIAALQAGFAGLARDPDFARLAGHQVDPERFGRELGRIV